MEKINYRKLNSRQQENYNFQKFAALLADYGFNSIRLSDDYLGADFLAMHIDGEIIKVQLKGRLSTGHKYVGKNLWIAFPENGDWYLYPHDDVHDYFLNNGRNNEFSCNYIPKKHMKFMSQFRVGG